MVVVLHIKKNNVTVFFMDSLKSFTVSSTKWTMDQFLPP